jgi:GrpB-like predicted nucleotidyltransferase (UPF0157 family)
MKIVEVLPHDPKWIKQFQKEKEFILSILKNHCVQIEHVGSTSIPDIYAKRDIDILLVIDELQNAHKLEEFDFVYKGEFNIPLRFCFSKNNEESKVNLHVCEKDHGFFPLQICFRGYLLANPERAKVYSDLKLEILKRGDASEKMRGWLRNYGRYKDVFIKESLKIAGFDSLIVNFVLHFGEIDAVKKMRENAGLHPESPTLGYNHDTEKHMILSRGIDIIGYTHFEILDGSAVFHTTLFADDVKESEKKQFDSWVKRWLSVHDIKG